MTLVFGDLHISVNNCIIRNRDDDQKRAFDLRPAASTSRVSPELDPSHICNEDEGAGAAGSAPANIEVTECR
jgi:hypothetical protein